MAQDYRELYNEEAGPTFDYEANFVFERRVKGYVKSAGSVAWSVGLSLTGIPGIGSIPSFISAVSTTRHLNALIEFGSSDTVHVGTIASVRLQDNRILLKIAHATQAGIGLENG